MKASDPERARKTMEEHLRHAGEKLADYFDARLSEEAAGRAFLADVPAPRKLPVVFTVDLRRTGMQGEAGRVDHGSWFRYWVPRVCSGTDRSG